MAHKFELEADGTVKLVNPVELPEILDLLIVGGGPAGTAAAFRAKELGLAQPRVSHHLTILRNSSLVRDRRSGKQIFYSVNPDFCHNGSPQRGQSIQVDCLRVEFTES